MRTLKRILKRMFIAIFSIIIVLVVLGALFINLSPEFGGTISDSQKEQFSKSEHYKDGVFENLGGVTMSMGFSDYVKGLKGFFGPQINTRPKGAVPINALDALELANYKGPARMVWFGHSTFLYQSYGRNILIDPMLGPVPAPHPLLGGKRFSEELPIAIEQLPQIDFVVLSHDHYDHLDYGSILKLKDKVQMFFTPLGVGAHLVEWGVAEDRIKEMDWWDVTSFEGFSIKCVPAQHFSGRGLSDRGKTLWSGWVIKNDGANVFFSGDSGYGGHFTEIGEKYGPFDFAMLECGQYNKLWHEIHMMPEETAQAGVDVKAKVIMPIHWGAFKLAMHPWTDPVIRVSDKAKELNLPIVTPKIGEFIYLAEPTSNGGVWWKNVD
ncbi:MBL fold metallo-hydrolase [Maribacter flavus]|nr:MBL fold metallo-hydrolase [Maribacter flavus]